MTEISTVQLGEFELPFKRQATLKNVDFESGLSMLRLTLREGRRFTVVDLDASSARDLAEMMTKWAAVSGGNAGIQKVK